MKILFTEVRLQHIRSSVANTTMGNMERWHEIIIRLCRTILRATLPCKKPSTLRPHESLSKCLRITINYFIENDVMAPTAMRC
jgi:hypothetical protein